jgi:hypothetical protein
MMYLLIDGLVMCLLIDTNDGYATQTQLLFDSCNVTSLCMESMWWPLPLLADTCMMHRPRGHP